jgi:hypothetical protein
MSPQEHLEAFGSDDIDDIDDADSDFASEHSDTTVDRDIEDGKDKGETESPKGWDGMDQEGPP